MRKFKLGLKSLVIAAALVSAVSTQVLAAGSTVRNFVDVPSKHYAKSYIDRAVSKGIVAGCSKTRFCPNLNITEQEFVLMITRAAGHRPDVRSAYEIIKKKNYPADGIKSVSKRSKAITRGKVAELIAATHGKNYIGDNAVKYVMGNKIAVGKTGNSVSGYRSADKLTRAEATVILLTAVNKSSNEFLKARPTTPSSTSELPRVPTNETVAPITSTGVNPINPKLSTIERNSQDYGRVSRALSYLNGYKIEQQAFSNSRVAVLQNSDNDPQGINSLAIYISNKDNYYTNKKPYKDVDIYNVTLEAEMDNQVLPSMKESFKVIAPAIRATGIPASDAHISNLINQAYKLKSNQIKTAPDIRHGGYVWKVTYSWGGDILSLTIYKE